MTCKTCQLITGVENYSFNIATTVFHTIAHPATLTLSATAGMLVLFTIIRGAVAGIPPHREMTAHIVSLFVASMFLGNYNLYIDFSYNIVRGYTNWIAGSILATSGAASVAGTSTASLLNVAEEVFFKAMNIASLIILDGNNIVGNIIAGVLLYIPYLASLVIFCGILLFTIFLAQVPVFLGPIIIVLGAFKSTRKLLFSAVDFYISSFFVTIMTCFFVAVSLNAFQMPAGLTPSSVPWWVWAGGYAGYLVYTSVNPSQVATFVWGDDFMIMLVLGYMMLFFLWNTPSLVAYFTGRVDSANVAGFFANQAGSAVSAMSNLAILLRGRK